MTVGVVRRPSLVGVHPQFRQDKQAELSGDGVEHSRRRAHDASQRNRLLRKIHAPQEISEARIRTQLIGP